MVGGWSRASREVNHYYKSTTHQLPDWELGRGRCVFPRILFQNSAPEYQCVHDHDLVSSLLAPNMYISFLIFFVLNWRERERERERERDATF